MKWINEAIKRRERLKKEKITNEKIKKLVSSISETDTAREAVLDILSDYDPTWKIVISAKLEKKGLGIK